MSNLFKDILKNKHVDEQFVVIVNRETTYINGDAKIRCKILKIPFDVDDPLIRIFRLSEKEFPNLFIFIVEIDKAVLCEEVKKFLISFSKSRPIILQFASKDEENSRLFYKEEKLNYFLEISYEECLKNSDSFPIAFLNILNGEQPSFTDESIKSLFKAKHSSITIRLLNVIKSLDEEKSHILSKKIILQSAATGSEEDFLAAFDCPFKDNQIITNIQMQEFLMKTVDEINIDDDKQTKESDETSETSILLTAVRNSNNNIFNYLMNNCTVFTRELPFDHRLKISSTAFRMNQIDVLCDLIKYFDFPFHEDFKLSKISHIRFRKIIADVEKFHNDIEIGDVENISKFIDDNLSLRIVCNVENESALNRALEMDQYEVFYYLMSLGFRAVEFNNYKNYVSEKRLLKMLKYAKSQIKENATVALVNEEKSVKIMSSKSMIHNKKISEQTQAEYRNKIKRWYRHIYNTKYGSKLFNAASQCEKLRIIFDFESKTVS